MTQGKRLCSWMTRPGHLVGKEDGAVVEHRPFGRGDGFKTTCGRASDFSVEETGVQNHLMPFRRLGNFVHPTLPVAFGRDNKSRWSLLSGVYVRGSKRSHTGK